MAEMEASRLAGPGVRLAGRPEVTSHAAIEQVAFGLFAERGFDDTTLDAIAEGVGVSRRTLFRYYRSKNDIPWGQFDDTLEAFATTLASMPVDLPLPRAIGRAIADFNDFPADASPSHLERMRLILETPTLLAHSVLRYAEWQEVISDYAAGRLGLPPDALQPRLIAQVSLAIALTAYGQWLLHPDTALQGLIAEAVASLEAYAARR